MHPPGAFSWVSDTVAGFAFPESKENLDYLVNKAKISHLITLTEDKPRHLSSFPSNEIRVLEFLCVYSGPYFCLALKNYFYPVEEFTSGDLEMIREIVGIIADAENKNEKVGVHCQYGQMRTGTILAAYLAYHHKIDGKEAIKRLYKMRSNSLISSECEQVLCEYAASIKGS